MMQNFLKKLNALQIKIAVKGDQLDIQAPKGVMTPALIAELKAHKDALLQLLQASPQSAAPVIPKAPDQEAYVLSSAQQRLWVLHEIEAGNPAYNIPAGYEIEGPLAVDLLEESFRLLIERHEILRTNFRWNKAAQAPEQFVRPMADLRFYFSFEDLSNKVDADAQKAAILQAEMAYRFDLEADSLLRVCLLQTGTTRFTLSFVVHHIVSDGWSASVMVQDLFSIYAALNGQREPQLSPLPIQYKDFAAWQQAQVQDDALTAAGRYWTERLSGELPVLDLPGAAHRPARKTYAGATRTTCLSPETVAAFKALCRRQEASSFMGFLAAVHLLLYKYARQEVIVLGSPITGRAQKELQDQIGFYVNMLVLKNELDPEQSFEAFLEQVRQNTLEAFRHQDYPYDQLIQDLEFAVDRSRNPFFDVVVTVEEEAGTLLSTVAGLQIRELPYEETTSKFDLEFAFRKEGADFLLALTYNTDLFAGDFMERMLQQFEVLLAGLVDQPQAPMRSLSYLPEAQWQQVVHTFNHTAQPFSAGHSYVDAFRETVARYPDRIALQLTSGTRLSYADLDRRSDAFAHYLSAHHGVAVQERVGVCLERGEGLVITYLALLKIAAIYLPIDPAYPLERSKFMQADSACRLVIDEALFAAFVRTPEVKDTITFPAVPEAAIAYTIYTSGSTGQPKGVSLSHRNLLNLCRWHNRYYAVSEHSGATLYSGIGFDASIWEMSPYLLAGATLFPIEDPTIRLAPEVLCAYLNEHRISHSFLPTTLCQEFVARSLTLSSTTVLTGGDHLKLTTKPAFPLYNNYGPTENTVVSTAFDLADWDEQGPIPIGRPIDNTQVHLLDADGRPVPIGVPGELCLSGESLATGYLNRPELTDEKFVPHPLVPGARMYRTGDLGKWLPDGNLVFLGRNDDQIQLRGFRIELGEIEQAILRFSPQITQAVATVQQTGHQKVLVAFYTASNPIDELELHRYLGRHLPEYMKPGILCALDVVPLTRNGKIDRSALLEQLPATATSSRYVEPQTEVEQALAAIWQRILGLPAIGLHDNFFDLGGYSLQATRMLYEINDFFEIRLQMKEVFTATTIHELAQLVENELIFKTGISTAPADASDHSKKTDVWEL